MKKNYLLLFYFSSFIAFAQAPNIQWQKTFGGNSIDILKSVYERNGNFYLSGFSNSNVSGDKTLVNGATNTNDIWALSLNSSGTLLWQNSYLHSNPSDLLQDNIASLHYFDNAFFFGVTYDDFDVWMTRAHKFNDSGIYQGLIFPGKDDVCSGINYSSSYDVTATDYFKTSDGNYFFSGTNGNLFQTCGGFNNYFISKSSSTSYNSTIWSKEFSANNYEELKSTIETNDGGFLLSGTSNSTISGDKTENSNGGNDFWVIKTNSLGTIVWQNTIGGNLSDEPVSAIQTNDGGYLIAGSSNSSLSGDKTENSKGGFDYWIVKLDSNGNVIWDKTIGGNLDDKIAKIIPTSDGNYVLIGSSKSTISGNKTESNRGEFDIWMLKINSSGSILWDKTIGGNLDDNAYDVIQSSDNGYLIGATSTSTISGDKTENNRGNKDYWAVKLETDNLSIPENNSLSTILLYPNPTDGIITIDFGAFQETVSINTLNVLGQLISKHNFSQISEKQLQIDEPSGVYFLEIDNGNQDKKVFKIVKN